MTLTIRCLSMFTLSAGMPLCAQEPAPAVPAGPGRVELRVVRATLRDTILLMAGGAILRREPEVGPWLVVSLQVTTPGSGFASTPTLTGAGLPAPRPPRGVSGDSAAGNDTPFLQYAARPPFVPQMYISGSPGWVGLTMAGAYGGAGWIGQSDSLDFMVTTVPQLEFQRGGRMTLVLAFNVSGGQGPYTLSLGGSTVDVSVSARPDQQRR